MKAAVLQGNGRSVLETRDAAAPGPGEVLLQLEGCGVCASTLPAWQGRPWFEYPLEAGSPGHEPWGRIVECGEGVTRLAPGDRVTGLSYRAYAEYDLALADQVVKLPDHLDDRPFPGEALACGMNVFDRAAIERDMPVAVVGAGFIGGMVVQNAAAAGAAVTAFSQREWSLTRAREQGAVAARPIDEIGGTDESWPCVVECTGTQAGLDAASKLVGIRGRLVVAGYHQEGKRQVDMQEWNWKGIDVINAHERDPQRYVAGMRAAIEAIEQKRIDPWPLFTHSLPLTDIDRAFKLMEQRPDGFTKAVLCL
ncbi:MAG TPA: alcohol dehydrogenase catalytic domain-containing protein [Woeseiaceae bacterium]|nr:alcohol dehydrogenase catalytic domain-containing protein [Woeseiaceae bacterium]